MSRRPFRTYYYNRLTGAPVTPDHWQTKIKKGDYYEAASETIVIYGEILGAALEKGYFHALAYSVWFPNGNEARVCVVEPTRILTKQEFEYARSCRWKVEDQSEEAQSR